MHSLSDTSVISQRQAIVDRIDALKQDIYNLLSQQNELLPVAALCPDVLLQVLDYASEASPDYRMQARVRFAQVCRHWRTVALGTPSFWSTIHHTQGDWKQTALLRCFLERSQSADIQVDWEVGRTIYRRTSRRHDYLYDSDRDDRFSEQRERERDAGHLMEKALEVLAANTQRMTSLRYSEVSQSDCYDVGRIWDLLEEHPPPLVHLEISGLSRDRDLSNNCGFTAQHLMRLSSMFPSLQELIVVLDKKDISLSTLPFEKWALPHTLTSLDIAYGTSRRETSEDTEPWSAILQHLRGLQNLCTLKLRNVVRCYDEDDIACSETLTLPSLRSLTLKGTIGTQWHIPFLSTLDSPMLAQVDVDVLVEGLDERIAGHLLSTTFPKLQPALLPGIMPRSQIVVLQQMTIDTSRRYHGEANMKVSCLWSTKFIPDFNCMTPSTSPVRNTSLHPLHSSINVHLRHSISRDSNDETGEDVQKYLDDLHTQGIPGLHSITALAFHGSRRRPIWSATPRGIVVPNTIRSMEELRILCLYDLTSALTDISLLFTPFSDGSHPFPHLHTLQVSGAKIRMDLMDRLENILRARQAAGLQRLRVVFVACRIYRGTRTSNIMASYKEKLRPLANIQLFKSDSDCSEDEEDGRNCWSSEDELMSASDKKEEYSDFEGAYCPSKYSGYRRAYRVRHEILSPRRLNVSTLPQGDYIPVPSIQPQ